MKKVQNCFMQNFILYRDLFFYSRTEELSLTGIIFLEISNAEDLRRVTIPDSQSSQDVDSDLEQTHSMSSRTSGHDHESGDNGDDKEIDSCSTSSEPSKFTVMI